jgi:threonine dehydratase
MICRGVSRVETIGEDQIAEAMRIYYTDTHNIAEGAGAAPLAALLKDGPRARGKKVAVILSGGNVDREVFLQVLQGQTPRV